MGKLKFTAVVALVALLGAGCVEVGDDSNASDKVDGATICTSPEDDNWISYDDPCPRYAYGNYEFWISMYEIEAGPSVPSLNWSIVLNDTKHYQVFDNLLATAMNNLDGAHHSFANNYDERRIHTDWLNQKWSEQHQGPAPWSPGGGGDYVIEHRAKYFEPVLRHNKLDQ